MPAVQNNRLHVLDAYRGFVIINMIFYHFIWDLHMFTYIEWSWYEALPGYIWQQFICWSFILISGFSWSLGSKPFKRGLVVLAAGFLVTSTTLIFLEEAFIFSGILTFLGSAMLLLIPLSKVLVRVSSSVGLFTSLALFFIFRSANAGYIGFMHWHLWPLPEIFYQNLGTAYLGFPPDGFYSADYFSLIPWFFLFLAGYFAHTLYMQKQKPPLQTWQGIPWLNFCGRHTLIIYLLHQPLLYGLVILLFGP